MKYCNLYKKDSEYGVRNNIDEFDVQLEMMANTPTLYQIACHYVLIGNLVLQFEDIRFK